MTEEIQQESEWNMATLYFQRLHAIITSVNESRANNDYTRLFASLQCLYLEIAPRMKPTRQQELRALLTKCECVITWNFRSVSANVLKNFFDLELELRKELNHAKLLVPDAEYKGL